jgi:hypothetical protein
VTTPAIPAQHNIGDTGHTGDHNSITDFLASHQASIVTLMSFIETAMAETDNNITISDQVSWVLKVNVPSGTRGTAPPIIACFSGTTLVGGINAYGELFAGPALPTRPAFVVKGLVGQTANLQDWSNSAGTLLSSVNADGSISVPYLTAATTIAAGTAITAATSITAGTFIKAPFGTTGDSWHYVSNTGQPQFQNGWLNRASGWAKLAYRMIMSPPNEVEIRGELNIPTSGFASTVFTLPAAYRPNSTQKILSGADSGNTQVASPNVPTFNINTDGTVAGTNPPGAGSDFCWIAGTFSLDI